jgi:hypothetical protein
VRALINTTLDTIGTRPNVTVNIFLDGCQRQLQGAHTTYKHDTSQSARDLMTQSHCFHEPTSGPFLGILDERCGDFQNPYYEQDKH